MPAFYVMGACLVGLVAVWKMQESAGASLRNMKIPGIKTVPIPRHLER
jgi:MHS family proline/betaine transporter-like MFS transporter